MAKNVVVTSKVVAVVCSLWKIVFIVIAMNGVRWDNLRSVMKITRQWHRLFLYQWFIYVVIHGNSCITKKILEIFRVTFFNDRDFLMIIFWWLLSF